MNGRVRFLRDDPGGLEVLRPAIFQALRESAIERVPERREEVERLQKYIDFADESSPTLDKALRYTQEILWELMIERVLVPGKSYGGLELRYFRVTDYGKKVIEKKEYIPHDPKGYLDLFAREVGQGYEIALKYLEESLYCFTNGCLLASSMMLGIASESVFLQLCDKLLGALKNSKQRTEFEKICSQNSIKRKQEWVREKLEEIQRSDRKALPEDMILHLLGIFSLIRMQRNSIGHPQDNIPKISRGDALGNLYVFPRYCKSVGQVIAYLGSHKV